MFHKLSPLLDPWGLWVFQSVMNSGAMVLASSSLSLTFLFPDFPLQLLNVLRPLYLKAHSVLGIEVTLLKWSMYVLIFNFKFLVSDLKTTQNKIKIISNPITSWNQDFQGKNQEPQIHRWHHPCGRKWRRTKEPLDERGEWKSWLKTPHSEN